MDVLRKNLKFIIIIIVLILLYVVVAVFINNKSNANTRSTDNYLLIGDDLIWHEKGDGQWYQVKKVNDNLVNREFIVYNDNETYKVKNLQYVDDLWYFFDKDYNEMPRDKFSLAYSGDVKVSPVYYDLEVYDSNDDQYIMDVTNSNNSSQFEKYRDSLSKVTLDFDGDGTEETLYTITSNSLEVVDYDINSYMFVEKNGKIVSKLSENSEEAYGIVNIIDLDKDKNFEIIVFRGILNNLTLDSCYQIYKIDNGKLKMVQDCLYDE